MSISLVAGLPVILDFSAGFQPSLIPPAGLMTSPEPSETSIGARRTKVARQPFWAGRKKGTLFNWGGGLVFLNPDPPPAQKSEALLLVSSDRMFTTVTLLLQNAKFHVVRNLSEIFNMPGDSCAKTLCILVKDRTPDVAPAPTRSQSILSNLGKLREKLTAKNVLMLEGPGACTSRKF